MTRNKRHNPYKEANEAFLIEKSKEEGVVVLDSGVMYKVLQEGHGDKRPKTNGIVYVHYTGRLIDGTVFDTTEGELAQYSISRQYIAVKDNSILLKNRLSYCVTLSALIQMKETPS